LAKVIYNKMHDQRNIKKEVIIQGVHKSRPYFNMSNLFIKIYNVLCYTTNLYLQ